MCGIRHCSEGGGRHQARRGGMRRRWTRSLRGRPAEQLASRWEHNGVRAVSVRETQSVSAVLFARCPIQIFDYFFQS